MSQFFPTLKKFDLRTIRGKINQKNHKKLLSDRDSLVEWIRELLQEPKLNNETIFSLKGIVLMKIVNVLRPTEKIKMIKSKLEGQQITQNLQLYQKSLIDDFGYNKNELFEISTLLNDRSLARRALVPSLTFLYDDFQKNGFKLSKSKDPRPMYFTKQDLKSNKKLKKEMKKKDKDKNYLLFDNEIYNEMKDEYSEPNSSSNKSDDNSSLSISDLESGSDKESGDESGNSRKSRSEFKSESESEKDQNNSRREKPNSSSNWEFYSTDSNKEDNKEKQEEFGLTSEKSNSIKENDSSSSEISTSDFGLEEEEEEEDNGEGKKKKRNKEKLKNHEIIEEKAGQKDKGNLKYESDLKSKSDSDKGSESRSDSKLNSDSELNSEKEKESNQTSDSKFGSDKGSESRSDSNPQSDSYSESEKKKGKSESDFGLEEEEEEEGDEGKKKKRNKEKVKNHEIIDEKAVEKEEKDDQAEKEEQNQSKSDSDKTSESRSDSNPQSNSDLNSEKEKESNQTSDSKFGSDKGSESRSDSNPQSNSDSESEKKKGKSESDFGLEEEEEEEEEGDEGKKKKRNKERLKNGEIIEEKVVEKEEKDDQAEKEEQNQSKSGSEKINVSELDPKFQSETDTKSDSDSKSKSESETQSDSEFDSETLNVSELDPKFQSETDTKFESDSELDSGSDAKEYVYPKEGKKLLKMIKELQSKREEQERTLNQLERRSDQLKNKLWTLRIKKNDTSEGSSHFSSSSISGSSNIEVMSEGTEKNKTKNPKKKKKKKNNNRFSSESSSDNDSDGSDGSYKAIRVDQNEPSLKIVTTYKDFQKYYINTMKEIYPTPYKTYKSRKTIQRIRKELLSEDKTILATYEPFMLSYTFQMEFKQNVKEVLYPKKNSNEMKELEGNLSPKDFNTLKDKTYVLEKAFNLARVQSIKWARIGVSFHKLDVDNTGTGMYRAGKIWFEKSKCCVSIHGVGSAFEINWKKKKEIKIMVDTLDLRIFMIMHGKRQKIWLRANDAHQKRVLAFLLQIYFASGGKDKLINNNHRIKRNWMPPKDGNLDLAVMPPYISPAKHEIPFLITEPILQTMALDGDKRAKHVRKRFWNKQKAYFLIHILAPKPVYFDPAIFIIEKDFFTLKIGKQLSEIRFPFDKKSQVTSDTKNERVFFIKRNAQKNIITLVAKSHFERKFLLYILQYFHDRFNKKDFKK
ncbi:cerebellar degeneration-related antigen 1 [Anaeramoeba flamelloides]|uniref:Cerebellar degeneration-related antigen 1 n=1 Tax=Anaeramoeba flamelloides TaxID=1746091 RepID=A0ABQ8XHD5_9EUKA|nr:cerebellar degeneration-related antigen 1 [Anaeramoeba flamelloides]